MKIVLIISDTFRYDHVGSNKMESVSTPEIDELIADSVFFERCITGSFPTVPHRFDLLTGTFGFPFHGWEQLTEKDVSMAEILLDYGYITQMITDTANLLRRGFNYDRGYIGYHLEKGQERDISFTKMNEPIRYVIPYEKTRPTYYFGDHPVIDISQWANSHWRYEEDRFAPKTARHTCRWLETNYRAEDFYLHVDFFDPHEPWDPPEYLVAKYADPNYTGIPMIQPNYGVASAFSKDEIENMRAHYKAEVEMVSKSVGSIIRKMKETGIYDESLIIFTTDHGIYLGEHDRTGKTNLSVERDPRGTWPLYEEVSRLPLAFKMPGGQYKGKRIQEIVQPVDILPTVLELTGIDPAVPLPGKSVLPDRELRDHLGIKYGRDNGLPSFHGQSLMPLFQGDGKEWDREYAFSNHETLLPDPNAMLFWTTITGKEFTLALGGSPGHTPEMYHLAEDPKQETNVYEQYRDIAANMAQALFDFLESIGTEKERIEALKSRLS